MKTTARRRGLFLTISALAAACALAACATKAEPDDEIVTTPGTPAPQVAAPTTAPTAATTPGACEDLGALSGTSLEAAFAGGAAAPTQTTSFGIAGRPVTTKARIVAVGDASGLTGAPAVLGAGPNANLSTCTHCLLVAVGCGADCSNAAWFYARAGKATFTSVASAPGQAFAGTFEDVTLEQVTIDKSTLATSPVPGGACIRVPSLAFAATTGGDPSQHTPPSDGGTGDGGTGDPGANDSGPTTEQDGGSGGGGGCKGCATSPPDWIFE